MVDILEAQFPKGKCKERGRALVMLSYIEMMLQGKKFGTDGYPTAKCFDCYDKGYFTKMIGGTEGYTDWGALKKIKFSGAEVIKVYCKCAKGKRLKRNAN